MVTSCRKWSLYIHRVYIWNLHNVAPPLMQCLGRDVASMLLQLCFNFVCLLSRGVIPLVSISWLIGGLIYDFTTLVSNWQNVASGARTPPRKKITHAYTLKLPNKAWVRFLLLRTFQVCSATFSQYKYNKFQLPTIPHESIIRAESTVISISFGRTI